jgi:anti-sigma B factor antagonist
VLTVDCTEHNDVCIISIKGDLLFNELEEADRVFMEKICTKPRVIGLNCKYLKNLDSSGLGLFIKFSKEADKSQAKLVFLNITDHISTLFDVSKLDSMFETMPEADFKKAYMS